MYFLCVSAHSLGFKCEPIWTQVNVLKLLASDLSEFDPIQTQVNEKPDEFYPFWTQVIVNLFEPKWMWTYLNSSECEPILTQRNENPLEPKGIWTNLNPQVN